VVGPKAGPIDRIKKPEEAAADKAKAEKAEKAEKAAPAPKGAGGKKKAADISTMK
jgi:hypothetical protein